MASLYSLLTALLQRGSVVCQIGIAKALAKFCRHPDVSHQQTQGFKECIRSVVGLLMSRNQSLLQYVLAAMQQLALHHHRALYAAGVVPSLIQLLTEGTSVCQLGSTRALGSLSDIALHRSDISEALQDSIELLVTLMEQGSSDLQLAASSLLTHSLIDSPVNAQRFAKSDGTAAVARILEHHSVPAQEAALQCLRIAAESYPDLHIAISKHLLPAITDMLSDPCKSLQSSAASLVRCVASTQSARLCRAGLHTKVLRLLMSGKVSVHLVDTLYSLMLHQPKICDSIVAAGGLDVIINLLHAPDSSLQITGAIVLGQLALNHPQRKAAVIKAGGISALARLLENSSDNVAQQGAFGLQTLASGDASCRQQVADCGCIPMLVKLLQTGAAAAAAGALTALSEGSACTQQAVVNNGVIPAFASLLRSSIVPEQLAAMRALRSLLCDQPAYIKAASEAGAVLSLTDLVRSTDGEVQQQAVKTWQIVAAGHPASQMAISEAGGVERLAEATSKMHEGNCVCRRGAGMLRSISSPGHSAANLTEALQLLLQGHLTPAQVQCNSLVYSPQRLCMGLCLTLSSDI